MSIYGGSFVKELAKLAQRADSRNLQKIKDTWPEYWEEYEEKGQELRFKACPFGECDGSGEVSTDESDGEGHIMRGVGTATCRCKIKHDDE